GQQHTKGRAGRRRGPKRSFPFDRPHSRPTHRRHSVGNGLPWSGEPGGVAPEGSLHPGQFRWHARGRTARCRRGQDGKLKQWEYWSSGKLTRCSSSHTPECHASVVSPKYL